jgi:predicted flavoprotein YhiN
LPDRLAAALCAAAAVDPARSLAQLRREERIRLIETLVRGELPSSGHEGYPKAEVTGRRREPDASRSGHDGERKHPGLFVCGEMLDAFGPIGGFNFQWTWATGRAAGIGAANK